MTGYHTVILANFYGSQLFALAGEHKRMISSTRSILANCSVILRLLICTSSTSVRGGCVPPVFHALVERPSLPSFKLILDDVHLLARLDILHHRARGVQHRHQRGRRHHPHPPLHRIIHHIGMMRVDLGEHRFGGNEHYRAVRSHPRNDVFTADVVHMPFDVRLELALRQRLVRLGQPRSESGGNFPAETLRRHHAGQFRQHQHAIGAVPWAGCAASHRIAAA